jgi:hypothetical protein
LLVWAHQMIWRDPSAPRLNFSLQSDKPPFADASPLRRILASLHHRHPPKSSLMRDAAAQPNRTLCEILVFSLETLSSRSERPRRNTLLASAVDSELSPSPTRSRFASRTPADRPRSRKPVGLTLTLPGIHVDNGGFKNSTRRVILRLGPVISIPAPIKRSTRAAIWGPACATFDTCRSQRESATCSS